jgi:hypothetical protein
MEGESVEACLLDCRPPGLAGEGRPEERSTPARGEDEGVRFCTDVVRRCCSRRLITERAIGTVRFDRRVFGSWPKVTLPRTSMAVVTTMIRDRRTSTLALVSPTASPQRSPP